jgi:hypothetical protein
MEEYWNAGLWAAGVFVGTCILFQGVQGRVRDMRVQCAEVRKRDDSRCSRESSGGLQATRATQYIFSLSERKRVCDGSEVVT